VADTYYAQSNPPKTMTVGELIEKLSSFDPQKLVIFESPRFGAFGSETKYSLDHVNELSLERKERTWPAVKGVDEEGDPFECDEWVEVWEAWNGIVIR
jgi:hypothetical protein